MVREVYAKNKEKEVEKKCSKEHTLGVLKLMESYIYSSTKKQEKREQSPSTA